MFFLRMAPNDPNRQTNADPLSAAFNAGSFFKTACNSGPTSMPGRTNKTATTIGMATPATQTNPFNFLSIPTSSKIHCKDATPATNFLFIVASGHLVPSPKRTNCAASNIIWSTSAVMVPS